MSPPGFVVETQKANMFDQQIEDHTLKLTIRPIIRPKGVSRL